MGESFHGIGVCAGVAIGKALLLDRDRPSLEPRRIQLDEADREVERFDQARKRARAELEDLERGVLSGLAEPYPGMLEAQLLILEDPALVSETVSRIREGTTADWALAAVVDAFVRRFESMEDTYHRERAADLSDVHRRIERALRGETRPEGNVPEGPVVVVAKALGPSDTVALARKGVVGLAVDAGGRTSHTAILAQALSLPAVVALHDVSGKVTPGQTVVVDGGAGTVVLAPDEDQLARARARQEAWIAEESAMATARDLPVVTRDGIEVVLRANIEFPEEVASALRYGARGIGLYRSEFLFVRRAPSFPTEDDHYRTYRELAEKVAPHPAVIRTLDLGGEKYFHEVLDRSEPNPTLGLRGVRLCLKRADIFRPQVCGLLRAAAHADVRVLLPFITSPEEVREVRRILAEEADGLAKEGIERRADLPVGVMIEVPAAAVAADLLAKEADFLSLGTNDLIQYALAVDRGNESVAPLYEPLHPAVLRMLAFAVRSGKSRGIPISICGEMAANPALAPLLVGLGLRELSMPPRSVSAVRAAIRGIDASLATRLAEEALDLGTAEEVQKRLRSNVSAVS
jgi:phosphotransferase system enzyme I (PtsI)